MHPRACPTLSYGIHPPHVPSDLVHRHPEAPEAPSAGQGRAGPPLTCLLPARGRRGLVLPPGRFPSLWQPLPRRAPANHLPPARRWGGKTGRQGVPIYLATCSARPDWLVRFGKGEGRGAPGRGAARGGGGREEARPLPPPPPPPPEGRSAAAAAGPRAQVTAGTCAPGGAERSGPARGVEMGRGFPQGCRVFSLRTAAAWLARGRDTRSRRRRCGGRPWSVLWAEGASGAEGKSPAPVQRATGGRGDASPVFRWTTWSCWVHPRSRSRAPGPGDAGPGHSRCPWPYRRDPAEGDARLRRFQPLLLRGGGGTPGCSLLLPPAVPWGPEEEEVPSPLPAHAALLPRGPEALLVPRFSPVALQCGRCDPGGKGCWSHPRPFPFAVQEGPGGSPALTTHSPFPFAMQLGPRGRGCSSCVLIYPSFFFAMQRESTRLLVLCVHLFFLPLNHAEDSRGCCLSLHSASSSRLRGDS